MADYRAMYLKMMNAAEEAMEILIKAQHECEELYMSAEEPVLLHFDDAETYIRGGKAPDLPPEP
jgi:hypothetical protein